MSDEDSVAVSSGTPAQVAWEMVKYLRKLVPEADTPAQRIENYLDVYAKCLHATSGRRQPK